MAGGSGRDTLWSGVTVSITDSALEVNGLPRPARRRDKRSTATIIPIETRTLGDRSYWSTTGGSRWGRSAVPVQDPQVSSSWVNRSAEVVPTVAMAVPTVCRFWDNLPLPKLPTAV